MTEVLRGKARWQSMGEAVERLAKELVSLPTRGASVVGDWVWMVEDDKLVKLGLRAIRGQKRLLLMREDKCVGSATPEELGEREDLFTRERGKLI